MRSKGFIALFIYSKIELTLGTLLYNVYMEKNCLYCGTSFYVKPCRMDRTKFHTKECQIAYLKENPMPLDTRLKISKAKGGIKTETRICARKDCGTEFTCPIGSKKIYHDRACSCKTIGEQSHPSWNTGLNKDNCEALMKQSKKQSSTMKSKYANGEMRPWNEGLTAQTDPRMAKMNETLTKMRNTPGEWKDSWRAALRKGQVKAWGDGKYNRELTSPEKLTWTYLESLGYLVKHFKDISTEDPINTWYCQFPFKEAFVPDFACPDLKCVIEVHGCAIHAHDLSKCQLRGAKYGWNEFAENNRKRDRCKYSLYHRSGWKWAIIWQCEADRGDFHRIAEYLELNKKEIDL